MILEFDEGAQERIAPMDFTTQGDEMKRLRKQFRQGDVYMVEASIPKDAVKQAVKDRAVMAYGEVTGHAHAIEEVQDIELYEKDGRTFVRVINAGGTPLTHEEHGTVVLPTGDYERVIQREYSPEAIRNVAD